MAAAGGSWKGGSFVVANAAPKSIYETAPVATTKRELQSLYPHLSFMQERRGENRFDVSVNMSATRDSAGRAAYMVPDVLGQYYGTGRTPEDAYRALDNRLRRFYGRTS